MSSSWQKKGFCQLSNWSLTLTIATFHLPISSSGFLRFIQTLLPPSQSLASPKLRNSKNRVKTKQGKMLAGTIKWKWGRLNRRRGGEGGIYFNYRQHFLLQSLITQGIILKVFIGALGLLSISLLFGPMLGSCHPDDDWDWSIQSFVATHFTPFKQHSSVSDVKSVGRVG